MQLFQKKEQQNTTVKRSFNVVAYFRFLNQPKNKKKLDNDYSVTDAVQAQGFFYKNY